MSKILAATAWSQLSSAQYIDEVIESVRAHPDIWAAARDSLYKSAGDRFDEYEHHLVRLQSQTGPATTFHKVWVEALAVVWWEMGPHPKLSTYDAAMGAILALVAYDHSSKYYLMDDPDKLRVWHALSDDHACLLLLPAVIAKSKIQELVK